MPRFQKHISSLIFNILIAFPTISSKSSNPEIAELLHRPIRALTFPDSSTTGVSIFAALAVPLEEPYKSISVAYFFEAAYALPSNLTYYEPWVDPLKRGEKKRSIDRATVYQVFENRLQSSGYDGRACLLRAICETSEYSVRHNGLVGDILHVILTPTTSRAEELPQDILQAEMVGRNGTCSKYQPQCPVGLFDLIGVLV